MLYKIFLTIPFLIVVFTGNCQKTATFDELITTQINQPEKAISVSYKNPFLGFYKKYISSQDGNNCGFYPSCSQFAFNKMKLGGLFIGVLAAFDRLSRCNGHNHLFYIPSKYNNKIIDLPK